MNIDPCTFRARDLRHQLVALNRHARVARPLAIPRIDLFFGRRDYFPDCQSLAHRKRIRKLHHRGHLPPLHFAKEAINLPVVRGCLPHSTPETGQPRHSNDRRSPSFGRRHRKEGLQSLRRQDVLRQFPEQRLCTILGKRGIGHVGILGVHRRQDLEHCISPEFRGARNQPLCKSTWVSGIRPLKGDREVHTNREPSGRSKRKVGHRSSPFTCTFFVLKRQWYNLT